MSSKCHSTTETSLYRLQKVAFWAHQVAENEFKVPFDHLKKTLSRTHPNCILGWSRGRKCVRSAWRQHETSFSRPAGQAENGFKVQ